MLLGTVLDQDVEEWERMIAVNQKGLLYMTNAALPHLLAAANDGFRSPSPTCATGSTRPCATAAWKRL
ncbi:MAG TPA: hypothetical protein VLR26_13955 [Frankiaceae bacterium]|nr:hypothetical protein [Frankiaceae bacterium]